MFDSSKLNFQSSTAPTPTANPSSSSSSATSSTLPFPYVPPTSSSPATSSSTPSKNPATNFGFGSGFGSNAVSNNKFKSSKGVNNFATKFNIGNNSSKTASAVGETCAPKQGQFSAGIGGMKRNAGSFAGGGPNSSLGFSGGPPPTQPDVRGDAPSGGNLFAAIDKSSPDNKFSKGVVADTSHSSSKMRNISNRHSLENSCVSPDGRTFHSYQFDESMGQHVIVSELAPFGARDLVSTSAEDSSLNTGKPMIKITTVLHSSTIGESLNIDSVMGLVCVDGTGRSDQQMRQRDRQKRTYSNKGDRSFTLLPWLCLYNRSAAFLLSIDYLYNEDEESSGKGQNIIGRIRHVVEPFEKHLLMAPRGSSIVRIRSAPISQNIFNKCGAMAMLLKEGGDDDGVEGVGLYGGGGGACGWALVMYHGLPESLLGNNSSVVVEGHVTTPLRFNYEDLVRGLEDTVDAENEAYASLSDPRRERNSTKSMSKNVSDFCFFPPSLSASASGASVTFSATSILVLCNDGSIYAASPIIFDGTVLPRSMVAGALSNIEAEIDASKEFLGSSQCPQASFQCEQVESRMRQCKAAKRYLIDAFSIPEEKVKDIDHATSSRSTRESYYVSASVVRPQMSYSSYAGNGEKTLFSQALSWHPRLQGPLVASSDSQNSYNRIEPFGAIAGAGIVDGFVVVSHASETNIPMSPVSVEFGIIPGEGSSILPRFEFESDTDRNIIDSLLRGSGMYIDRVLIVDDESNADQQNESKAALSVAKSWNSGCSIVIDPLDDLMVHVLTSSQIVTISTDAVATTAQYFRYQSDTGAKDGSFIPQGVRTKVWSCLEVNSPNTKLTGACVSGDVNLGHIIMARLSNGLTEIVNVTASQCLQEASEQMKSKSDQMIISRSDPVLDAMKEVKPLHELLQPLVDQVCSGLSKMGKIVGSSTAPKDAGPETIAIFLDTQQKCEQSVVFPMEEMTRILRARRELLTEMYMRQSSDLERIKKELDEWSKRYESKVKRLEYLESNLRSLAERSSAVLTASRDLLPRVTKAELAYFKDVRWYETNCNKWDEVVKQLQKDASTTCDSMPEGGIESGDISCLVDLPPQSLETCRAILRGECELLRDLEKKVLDSSEIVAKISKTVSGLDSSDSALLRLISGDKENFH